MSQVPKENQVKKTSKIVLLIIVLVVLSYVLIQKDYIPSLAMLIDGQDGTLKHVEDVMELDVSQHNEVIVNKDQIVTVTKDGVKAITIEGEDIWADTHTLKNINVVQKSPYFAVGEKMGYKISIYDDKGKRSDTQFANPISYFSLNNLGDLVVIESTIDGHVVSAYNEKGESLGVKRITYIEDAGYPVVAEISPDGKMILVSYVDTNGVSIDSNIIGIKIASESIDDAENILYGRSYEDTLVSQLEFINQNTWVLVGDNLLAFNNVEGEEVLSIPNKFIKYAPSVKRADSWQGLIYAIISSDTPAKSAVHPVDVMSFYDQKGEEVFNLLLENKSTYMYSDGKTVIVGSDRDFVSYNRLGKKNWEYKASKDIQKIIQLYSDKQVVVVSKGKVELMQVVK